MCFDNSAVIHLCLVCTCSCKIACVRSVPVCMIHIYAQMVFAEIFSQNCFHLPGFVCVCVHVFAVRVTRRQASAKIGFCARDKSELLPTLTKSQPAVAGGQPLNLCLPLPSKERITPTQKLPLHTEHFWERLPYYCVSIQQRSGTILALCGITSGKKTLSSANMVMVVI